MKIEALKWITLGLILAMAINYPLSAQEDQSKTEKRSDRKETQSAMRESAKKLRKEIDEIKERQRNGEISEEEMGTLIAESAKRMAAEMDSLSRTLTENVTKEIEIELGGKAKKEAPTPPDAPSVRIERDDETGENKVKVKVKGRPKAPKRTETGFALTIGRNTVFHQGAEREGAIYPESDFWRGRYSEWMVLANTRIGGAKSPFYLNYGLSLVYNKTDLGANSTLALIDRRPQFVAPTGFALTKNRFENHYLNAQLGLKIAPKRNNSFHVEMNGFVGARFRTKQVLEYTTDLNERVRETRRNNFGTNAFNYGVSAAVGYDWVSLFARYELSSLFNDNSVYDFRPFSAGVRFTLM